MEIPKFGELSTPVQIALILAVGAGLWGVSEYLFLKPLVESNTVKQTQSDKLEAELVPLRPYEQRQKALIAENRQLEIQLANLRQIVPEQKEVDSFIRLVQGAATSSGVDVRRFTSRPIVTQDYYIEAPFEMELDSAYYQMMDFFDRLSKLARILNVSNLKMGSIEAGKNVGNKACPNGAGESVVAVCTITAFFSPPGSSPPVPATPGKPGAARK